jgi:hypothetical protein
MIKKYVNDANSVPLDIETLAFSTENFDVKQDRMAHWPESSCFTVYRKQAHNGTTRTEESLGDYCHVRTEPCGCGDPTIPNHNCVPYLSTIPDYDAAHRELRDIGMTVEMAVATELEVLLGIQEFTGLLHVAPFDDFQGKENVGHEELNRALIVARETDTFGFPENGWRMEIATEPKTGSGTICD